MKKTPLTLAMEITNLCNLSCRFCNIWKEPRKRSMTSREVRDILLSVASLPQFSLEYLSLTGGEPFLNPHLDAIFKTITLLKYKKVLKRDLEMGIFSNAYDTRRIVGFLRRNEPYLKRLTLGISLDGWGRTHDMLRGKKDAFERSLRTAQTVRRLFPQVRLEIKLTISPFNIGEISALYDYCRKNKIVFSPKIVETHARYYYHRVKTRLEARLSPRDKSRIKKALMAVRRAESQRNDRVVSDGALEALVKYLDQGPRFIRKCLTPSNSLFITSSGGVHPCLYQPAVANTHEIAWIEKIGAKAYGRMVAQASRGQCPKCLAYHGFLRELNIRKNS